MPVTPQALYLIVMEMEEDSRSISYGQSQLNAVTCGCWSMKNTLCNINTPTGSPMLMSHAHKYMDRCHKTYSVAFLSCRGSNISHAYSCLTDQAMSTLSTATVYLCTAKAACSCA